MRTCTRALLYSSIATIAIAPAAWALTDPIVPGDLTISLQRLVTVPEGRAIDLTYAPGDMSGRLFVASQGGNVHIIQGDNLLPTPYLSLSGAGLSPLTTGERGLLGMTFHPNFAVEGQPGFGKLYTYSSEVRAGTPDFNHPELVATGGGDHHSVIREWVFDVTNPNRVDLTVGSRVLMRINQPQSNHNAGAMKFGHDGQLYIALGDGGGSNDNSGGINNNTDGHTNQIGNAQDPTNIYGNILRINPTGSNSPNGQYGIPADNPFVNDPAALDEIFAWGLRNPWRMSIDRQTGAIYAGDVGQGQREEVNIIEAGKNYGWVFMEGTRVNRAGGVGPFEDPIGEYVTGAQGRAVVGGFVYRGSLIPELEGKYIFGDWQPSGGSIGRLFYMDAAGGDIFEFQLGPDSDAIPSALYSFGQDQSGELYALFSNGDVMRIIPEPGAMLLLSLATAALLRRRRP